MAAALEDIRARIDRGLGRAPANAPAEVPTLDSLKARIDRAFGRESREPVADPPKPARRVPRTPAALNNLLDEWDRLRNARGVSPERKAEAKRLQQDAINRLEGVKQLFANDYILLAGWVHYLAFDLFIGAWEVRDARLVGISHWLVIPCLLFTFMLGPVGLGMYFVLRWNKGVYEIGSDATST